MTAGWQTPVKRFGPCKAWPAGVAYRIQLVHRVGVWMQRHVWYTDHAGKRYPKGKPRVQRWIRSDQSAPPPHYAEVGDLDAAAKVAA